MRCPGRFLPDVYSDDALICFNSDAFRDDPEFRRAYQRGVQSLGGEDFYHWEWRFHVGMWAAVSASKLEGDFVECGVSHGFLSSAIMQHLDWDRLGKTFYLLDTFGGMDPRFVTDVERETGSLAKSQAPWTSVSTRIRSKCAEEFRGVEERADHRRDGSGDAGSGRRDAPWPICISI